MSYTCSKCNLDGDYNLLKADIGRKCPECEYGKILFIGYCRDCHSKMTITEDKKNYRCSECKTGHRFRDILRKPH